MKSDTLRFMARELAETVKRMPKLDWTARESVRADLRRNVRRLLSKYGYPPNLSENAKRMPELFHPLTLSPIHLVTRFPPSPQLVFKQAELSTANSASSFAILLPTMQSLRDSVIAQQFHGSLFVT